MGRVRQHVPAESQQHVPLGGELWTCSCGHSSSIRSAWRAGHVHAAHELGAIQTLLITDTLFRVNDVMARLKYSTLVEEVESSGGVVFVFSGAPNTSVCQTQVQPSIAAANQGKRGGRM
jgi:eRF1 domain 3